MNRWPKVEIEKNQPVEGLILEEQNSITDHESDMHNSSDVFNKPVKVGDLFELSDNSESGNISNSFNQSYGSTDSIQDNLDSNTNVPNGFNVIEIES